MVKVELGFESDIESETEPRLSIAALKLSAAEKFVSAYFIFYIYHTPQPLLSHSNQ